MICQIIQTRILKSLVLSLLFQTIRVQMKCCSVVNILESVSSENIHPALVFFIEVIINKGGDGPDPS